MIEGSDVGDESQQELDDDVAPDVQVELVLGPACPQVEPSVASGHQQADSERDQHDRFEDALDDDHFDEGIVLAAKGAELLPQPGEIVGSLDVGFGHPWSES